LAETSPTTFGNLAAQNPVNPVNAAGNPERPLAINRGVRLFVDNVLKTTIFGAKFNLAPFEIATQFQFQDFGVYFGGGFDFGRVNVGLSFKGLLNPEYNTTPKDLGFGGSVAYDGGAFGAGVRAFLARSTAQTTSYVGQIIGIEPSFFYNVMPMNLKFSLGTGIYFSNAMLNAQSINGQPDTIWALKPEIDWNFLGTGAGDGHTGMNVKYNMVSAFRPIGITPTTVRDSDNSLDVTFRWGF